MRGAIVAAWLLVSAVAQAAGGGEFPTLIAPDAVGQEGTSIAFDVPCSDAQGDAITVDVIAINPTPPSNPIFPSQNGPTPQTYPFSWTPGYSDAGLYTVTFRCSDGTNVTTDASSVTVVDVDRAPTVDVAGGTSVTVEEGSPISIDVTVGDPDGDVLTVSRSGAATGLVPDGDTFDGSGATWAWSWTPGIGRGPGTYDVVFTAHDGTLATSTTVTIAVTALPPPDAGPPDAAIAPDAGAPPDARGAPDAGAAGDGGGCGCQTSFDPSGGVVLAWLAVSVLIGPSHRRRRSRAPGGRAR